MPRRGLGDTSLATLTEVAQNWKQPLLAVARAADRAPELRPNVRAALLAFAQLVDSLAAQAQTLAPADVLERLIEAIKYEQVLMAEGPEGADRWENVRELVASAANWSEEVGGDEPSTPLERFLTEAALLSGNDSIAGAEDGVTLMTLHTAKGLEWPLVVLSGLEHGLFPLARAEEQPGGLEEERRLCYVGLTRARDKLYLTWAQTRRRGGELRHSIRSKLARCDPARSSGGTAELAGIFGGTTEWRHDRRALQRLGPPARAGRCRRGVPAGFAHGGVDAGCTRGGVAGRAAIREGRAGAAPPVRQRQDPGTDRHRTRPQGLRGLR